MADKNFIQKFGSLYTDKSINGYIRGGMWVATGLVVFILGKKAYKAIFPSADEKAAKLTGKNLDQVISDSKNSGVTQTFTNANYDSFANTLYESMRYAVGDDYAKVEEIMKKMQNDLDVALIVKSFGKRQNYMFGIPKGEPMDLFTFINSELGNEFLGVTSYRVKNINADWKKKGITFQI